MPNKVIITQSNYIPWKGYFTTMKKLSDEYLREYIALSCEQCQQDNLYQDRLDIKNYQDGLDLEEKKQ